MPKRLTRPLPQLAALARIERGLFLSRQTCMLFTVITLGLVPGSQAFAATIENSREEFQDAYTKQQTNSPSLFDTLPIQQIVPLEDTITFAAAANYKDVTIAPKGQDISSNRANLSERLDLKGWSASPYIALTAKQFGFGFTGELGRMTAHYQQGVALASGNPSGYSAGYNNQQAVMNYSGVGAYFYLSPRWKALPKRVSINFIAGGKSLNVQHESSGTVYSSSTQAPMTKYQYAVQNVDVGTNLGLNFVKRFTVLPWVDYSTNFVSHPSTVDQSSLRYQSNAYDLALKDDIDLFWHSAPKLRYGIDLVVNMFGINVHFGGLLGIIGNLSKGAGRIQDNSRYISFSFDIKG